MTALLSFDNVTAVAPYSRRGLWARIGAASKLGRRDEVHWNAAGRTVTFSSFSIDAGKCAGLCGDGFVQKMAFDLIAGKCTPASGQVTINGACSSAQTHRARLEGRKSITDLLSANAHTAHQLERILIFAELLPAAHMRLHALSLLEKIRLSTAVALLTEADIFLLETYLFACQKHFQDKVFDRMRLLKQQGKAFLIAAPGKTEAQPIAERYVTYKLG